MTIYGKGAIVHRGGGGASLHFTPILFSLTK